ncbi:MAG TPA: hypothetical protein VNT75_16405 [Symbiobacteriaceae bacterium]|nr:hypothetical protein [Symbiobacteriaceae bacterium]
MPAPNGVQGVDPEPPGQRPEHAQVVRGVGIHAVDRHHGRGSFGSGDQHMGMAEPGGYGPALGLEAERFQLAIVELVHGGFASGSSED